MRGLEHEGSQRGEVEIPKRNDNNVRWCIKTGCIVNNGSSIDVPVWISSDGLLVLPVGGNGGNHAEPGSRIRMSRSIWPICSSGDLGTIIDVRESEEHRPNSWLAIMDSGEKLYIFEGEFVVVNDRPSTEQYQPVAIDSSMAGPTPDHISQ